MKKNRRYCYSRPSSYAVSNSGRPTPNQHPAPTNCNPSPRSIQLLFDIHSCPPSCPLSNSCLLSIQLLSAIQLLSTVCRQVEIGILPSSRVRVLEAGQRRISPASGTDSRYSWPRGSWSVGGSRASQIWVRSMPAGRQGLGSLHSLRLGSLRALQIGLVGRSIDRSVAGITAKVSCRTS